MTGASLPDYSHIERVLLTRSYHCGYIDCRDDFVACLLQNKLPGSYEYRIDPGAEDERHETACFRNDWQGEQIVYSTSCGYVKQPGSRWRILALQADCKGSSFDPKIGKSSAHRHLCRTRQNHEHHPWGKTCGSTHVQI